MTSPPDWPADWLTTPGPCSRKSCCIMLCSLQAPPPRHLAFLSHSLFRIQANWTYQAHIGDIRPSLSLAGNYKCNKCYQTSFNRKKSSSSQKEPKPSQRRKFKEKSLSSLYHAQEDSTSRDSHRTNFFQENQPQTKPTTMYNDRNTTNSNHAIDADRLCLSPSVSRGRGLPGRVPGGDSQHDDGPGNGSSCHRKQFLQGL